MTDTDTRTRMTDAQSAQIRYIRTLLTHHEMSMQQLRDLGYAEAAIKAAKELVTAEMGVRV